MRDRLRMVLTALLALVALFGCGRGGEDAAAPSAAPGAVRMAAVGDSITAADSADLAAGELGRESWVWHALDDFAFAGGWAEWGATTAQMADGVEPVDADVLVILAGTNDAGVPFAQTAANLREIVDTVGVGTVVLSAVPPIDADPMRAAELNADLERSAAEEGWHWAAQPAEIADDGRFAAGMASDGLHPTEEGARLIGQAVAAAVREATG